MCKIKNNSIKIIFIVVFMFLIISFIDKVQAAGIDGTTIVLNARTWWLVDRMCKCVKRFD